MRSMGGSPVALSVLLVSVARRGFDASPIVAVRAARSAAQPLRLVEVPRAAARKSGAAATARGHRQRAEPARVEQLVQPRLTQHRQLRRPFLEQSELQPAATRLDAQRYAVARLHSV
jgi:hypothetical protein